MLEWNIWEKKEKRSDTWTGSHGRKLQSRKEGRRRWVNPLCLLFVPNPPLTVQIGSQKAAKIPGISIPQRVASDSASEATNLPSVARRTANSRRKTKIMDPAKTPLGQMLLDEITPVVMVLSTPLVEEACLKSGLSFLQMLTPFCSFHNIDGNRSTSCNARVFVRDLKGYDKYVWILCCSASKDSQWPALQASEVQIAVILCFGCQEARFRGNCPPCHFLDT